VTAMMQPMRVSTPGRSAELAVVSDFVASAKSEPSGLVIEGDAGIGKTTVWLAGVERAVTEGFRVLSARVGQAESVLAYATVADLISDVESEIIEGLPDVQRVALHRILLRTDDHGPESGPWVAAAAFMSVIQALTERSPVLLAIDDVQWLDSSSRAAVEFAIRRMSGRFGVMVTERTDSDQTVAASWLQVSRPDGIARIRVSPMSLGALHEVISARLGRSLPRPTMVRIAEVSGGNPFYAQELASAVVAGSGSHDAVLPATLGDLVRDRTQRYSPDTQEVLLAAACVASPTVELTGAATGLTNTKVVDLLERPELDGLLNIDGNRLRFSHPLLAQSVYTHATAAQRRRMHRALAEVEPQPELKARHLALSSTSADDEVLRSLDAAAEVARGRGAPSAAAELVDLARRLGGDDVTRRLRAAADHFQAGDTTAAQPLLESALEELESGFMRAIALLMLGGILIYENAFADAERTLTEAVRHAEATPALKVRLLMPLAFAQGLAQFRHDEQLATAREAVAVAEAHGTPADLSQALTQLVNMSFMAGGPLDEENLQKALELEDLTADVSVQFSATVIDGLLSAYCGRFDKAETKLSVMRRHFHERGAERDLMAIAGYRAIVAMLRGRYDDAAKLAEEALERSEQLGGNNINVIPLSVRAQIHAYTGHEDAARRDATAALEAAQRLNIVSMTAWPIMTMAFLDVAKGDYAAALTTWEPLFDGMRGRSNADPVNAFGLPDAIEAMVGLGRLEEAEQWLEPWEAHGRRVDRAWVLAVSARCRGLLLAARGDLDAATQVAERSMREYERLPMPFERARTLLLLGQLYRRKRQKQKAVDTLTEALQTFEKLGARVWAQRAGTELSRINVGRTQDVELTSSEQRVADLAATGMTNRDIATTLFISPKTVEHHIGRIYRKLGIRSRAELGRRMRDQ
jgi:DNA-binding CsgD family transcriptional regulator